MVYHPGVWKRSQATFIFVFNVGRGLSIFIRTPFNHGIIYDLGASDGFSPAEFLTEHVIGNLDEYRGSKIAQVILSHPHSDHIRELESIRPCQPLCPALLTCPHDKATCPPEAVDWDRAQLTDGTGGLLGRYRGLYEGRSPPLQTIRYQGVAAIPGVEYGIYYIRPPIVARLFPNDDHEYGNGMSLVLYYRHGVNSILIPGDINPTAFECLLAGGAGVEKRYTVFDRGYAERFPLHHASTSEQPGLAERLGEHGLTVLVAPHHGLESGFHAGLYDCMKDGKPLLNLVSEKRHTGGNGGSVDNRYQGEEYAAGVLPRVEGSMVQRSYSVSTRNGHHILIKFSGCSRRPEVALETDPVRLLNHLDG